MAQGRQPDTASGSVRRPRRVGVSLRTRITAWYGALLALTLLGFSTLLYFTLERSLASSVDDALQLRAEQIRRALLGPSFGVLLQVAPEDVPPAQVEGNPLEEFSAPGIYFQVLNPRGGVVYTSANLAGGQLPSGPQIGQTVSGGQVLVQTVRAGDVDLRVRTVPLRAPGGDVAGAVQVAQSLAPIQGTMAAVARLLFTGGTGALLLAVVAGWLFTERALQPVARITATARHIAATGDYRQRLAVAAPHVWRGDELHFLASTFNDMIARLEQVLESQRRLLADTSHELRNPLTVIRGNLALLRRDGVPEEARREAVQDAEEEAARMGRLVNDLLLLARADAGELALAGRRESVPLVELAAEVADQVRAASGGTRVVTLEAHAAPIVSGDRDRLKQLVANLLENAVRYTPEGGRITLRVAAEEAQHPGGVDRSRGAPATMDPPASPATAVLTVADSGVGISSEQLPHLFERFYRADRARSRPGDAGTGGTGLGLAIVRSIARAHGGSVEAASEGTGRGSTFTVRLPAEASVVGHGSWVVGRGERAEERATAAAPAPAPRPVASEGTA